jgi:MFS family permease
MDQRETVNSASIGELMQRLSQQTATLVRQELRLAQVEMKEKTKKAGIGAGLFGAGALLALGAFGAFVAGLVLAVGEAVDLWMAAFIVAAGLAVVAGVMVLGGKSEVAAATPPKPEATMENVGRDLAEVKARAARA